MIAITLISTNKRIDLCKVTYQQQSICLCLMGSWEDHQWWGPTNDHESLSQLSPMSLSPTSEHLSLRPVDRPIPVGIPCLQPHLPSFLYHPHKPTVVMKLMISQYILPDFRKVPWSSTTCSSWPSPTLGEGGGVPVHCHVCLYTSVCEYVQVCESQKTTSGVSLSLIVWVLFWALFESSKRNMMV